MGCVEGVERRQRPLPLAVGSELGNTTGEGGLFTIIGLFSAADKAGSE